MIRLTHVHITNIYPNAQNKWKYWTIYWYIIIGNMLWMYTMFFTWTTTTCPSRYPITTHQWLLFNDITNIYPDYIDYQILYALLLLYQYFTSMKIPVSLQLDCHICNLKKTKRDLSLFYCLSDFIVILLFGIFLGVYILNETIQIHISGTSFTSRWDRDLVPAKFTVAKRDFIQT
jgi:hypothetical protein